MRAGMNGGNEVRRRAQEGAGREGPHNHASTPGRSRGRLHLGSPCRKEDGGPALTNHAATEPAAQCLPGRALPPSLSSHTAPGTDAETQDTDSAVMHPHHPAT